MLYFTIKANVVNPLILAELIRKSGPDVTVDHFALGDSFHFHANATNKALLAEAVVFQLAEQLNRISRVLKTATDQVSHRGGEII